MKSKITNLEESVKARLKNKAQQTERPFSEVLQYYGMERFLYRLSESDYSGVFILKGALMFSVWEARDRRTTVDIDFLARYENKVSEIEKVVKEVCAVSVEPDGLIFSPESVKAQVIKEDADYEGVRVKFVGMLQRSRISIQIDFGFGDVIHPHAERIKYPTLLDFRAPELYGYTVETIVAEKFEAITKLKELNSRMKDFYDLWITARQFDFEVKELAQAIQKTFKKRQTRLPEPGRFFPSEIYDVHSSMDARWKGFLKREQIETAPHDLGDVGHAIEEFLLSPVQMIQSKSPSSLSWKAPGPWKK